MNGINGFGSLLNGVSGKPQSANSGKKPQELSFQEMKILKEIQSVTAQAGLSVELDCGVKQENGMTLAVTGVRSRDVSQPSARNYFSLSRDELAKMAADPQAYAKSMDAVRAMVQEELDVARGAGAAASADATKTSKTTLAKSIMERMIGSNRGKSFLDLVEE